MRVVISCFHISGRLFVFALLSPVTIKGFSQPGLSWKRGFDVKRLLRSNWYLLITDTFKFT